jgi:hypothetical protein
VAAALRRYAIGRRSPRFQQRDGIYDVASQGREKVIARIKEEARREAVRAGAAEDSLEIVDLEEIPLAYLPSNAVRFRVKAVGKLSVR